MPQKTEILETDKKGNFFKIKKEKINFFEELVKKIENQKINYAFLRGHEFIYNNKNCEEIDILIKKENLVKLKELFKGIKSSYHFKNGIDLTHPFLVEIAKERFVVYLDFQTGGVGYCGSPILKEDYLFDNRIKKRGFYELNNKARFLMLFIHGFIFKRRLKYFKKYEKEFLKLFNEIDRNELSKELAKMFNKKTSEEIIGLIERENLKGLFNLRNKLVRTHLIKNPLEIPKFLISKLMRFRNYFYLDRVFHFINPFKWAPLISFIGPDGCGKSTMARESKEYLNKFTIKNSLVSGGVFSGIRNIANRKKTLESYSKRVSRRRENNIKLLARIFLQIPKQIKIAYYRKKGIFVITDRYIYDVVFFYGAVGVFKYLIKIISQKPTKCFYLDVDPISINKRNKELEISAINKIKERINSNEHFFKLTKLKNENFEETKSKLKNYLNETISNV